jgi:hypothetical protein
MGMTFLPERMILINLSFAFIAEKTPNYFPTIR